MDVEGILVGPRQALGTDVGATLFAHLSERPVLREIAFVPIH